MKFLVLSLCVCAASAASFGLFNPTLQNSPDEITKTVATPARTAARIVASPAIAAAKVVARPAVAAAKVAAKPAEVAAKVVPSPAVTAKNDVPNPTVAAANDIPTPTVAANTLVATPAVAAAKAVAAPAVADTKVAAPVPKSAVSDAHAATIRDESDVRPDGYKYAFKTENGISAKSTGNLKKINDADALVVEGSYKYVAPDGTRIKVKYVADENGYQPQSPILPVGPPTPEVILRALEYIASQPKWIDPRITSVKN